MTVVAESSRTLTEEYLARVQEIEPILREHADANERERHLVEPVVDALRDTGMYRIGVPRHYGGSQLDPLAATRVVKALAEIDSAAAWNVGIAAGSANLLGLFDPSVPDAVYREGPDTVCAGSVAAPVFVTASDDGFEVNGEARFLSGAHQASWFMSIAVQLRDGAMVTDASGEQPAVFAVCVPREEVKILDRWQVSAMRGTGSTDVAFEGARVPSSQVIAVEHLSPAGHFSDPEFQLIPWYAVHLEAAVSIGIARAAVRELKELAVMKIAMPEMQPIAQRERLQHNLALATALIDGADAYLSASMSDAYAYVSTAGRPLPLHIKAGAQLAGYLAAQSSTRAVDLVCEAAGTSSARLEHRFERHFRDVHFLTKHAQKSPDRVTDVGKMLLGIPSGWFPLEA